MKPLAVDLCAGLGGWTEGLLAESWDVVGFDIERHEYGEHRYPAQLVLQDILTLSGRQFRGKVSLIVASPPCQFFSYVAMPWTRGKELAKAVRADPVRLEKELALFRACERIGREAECPIVIENVQGAQPWVGRSKWHYGSYHLWGDVPALMPVVLRRKVMKAGVSHRDGSDNFHQGKYDDSVKVGGLDWNDRTRKGQAFNTHAERATKTTGTSHVNRRDGYDHTRHLTNQAEHDGVKQGGDWCDDPASMSRRHSSKSSARRASAARIAKIPFTLAQWIAHCYLPRDVA